MSMDHGVWSMEPRSNELGSKTLLLRTGSEAASGPPDSAEDRSLAFPSLATTAPGIYLTVPSIPVYLGLVNINQCCMEVPLRGSKTQIHGSPYRNHQSPR